MDEFGEENDKGLFTFYREQAQFEEQMKVKKREIKEKRKREAEEKRKKQEQAKLKMHNIELYRLERAAELEREKERVRKEKEAERLQKQKQIKEELATRLKNKEKQKRELHQPKYKSDRKGKRKRKAGHSVVIINGSEEKPIHFQYDLNNIKSANQKGTLRKIEQLINQKNNNRYFLQNKQLPSEFGKQLLEKQITSQDESPDQKVQIPQSYFNHYGDEIEMEKSANRYLPVFSYQKLPQISQRRQSYNSTNDINSKRAQKKILEDIIKSGKSHMLLRSSRDDSLQKMKEQVKLMQVGQKIGIERSPSKLNDQQRKLLQIIRSGRQKKDH